MEAMHSVTPSIYEANDADFDYVQMPVTTVEAVVVEMRDFAKEASNKASLLPTSFRTST
jgi:hypothetical protein